MYKNKEIRMNKILCIFTVLLLFFIVFTGCGGESSPPWVGVWSAVVSQGAGDQITSGGNISLTDDSLDLLILVIPGQNITTTHFTRN
jgi:hypothetical protein